MPWIFNPNRSPVQIVKANGHHGYVPGKSRIYLHPNQISGALGAQLLDGSLMNKGGDPVSVVPADESVQMEMESDTSSKLYEIPVIVQADSPSEQVEEIAVEVVSPEEVVPVKAAVEANESELAESTEDNRDEPDPAPRSRRSRRSR